MGMVSVYDGDRHEGGRIVARVQYNSHLDHWDGNNWSDGGTGTHLGITQLKKSGKMVLIHGTQWQGCRDWAKIVSDADALQAILKNDPDELKNWPHLQKLQEETIDSD